METGLKKYFDLILCALDNVEQPYYNLKTTYEPSGIVRERVFCYELYHQIRCLQTKRNEIELTLNGEIDKRGHVAFAQEDQKNPDFVFHIPGEMIGNTIVLEVKGRPDNSYKENCKKDFETIYCFIKKYHYKLGLFILYNHSLKECKNSLKSYLKCELNFDDFAITKNIYLVCKENHVSQSEYCTLFDFLK